MKTIIKPSIHSFIYDILLLCPLWLITVLSVVFAIRVTDNRLWMIICSVMFGAISTAGIIVILHEIQWVIVTDDAITSRNIFGIVKRVRFLDARRFLIVDAVAFTSRGGIRKTVPSLVISSVKSIRPSSMYYAANRRKDKYVIMPYNKRNAEIIGAAYKSATDKDIVIE